MCGYKEPKPETYTSRLCTHIHLDLAYMWHTHIWGICIWINAVCIGALCAYKLLIDFIYAHILSNRFFPCGYVNISAVHKVIKVLMP